MTITDTTHPSWCDPRAHLVIGEHDHDHRDIPADWELPDHGRVGVGMSQLDNPTVGDVDHPHIRLQIDDGDSTAAVHLHLGDLDQLVAELLARRALVYTPGTACSACGRTDGYHATWCDAGMTAPALLACGYCGAGSGHFSWCELLKRLGSSGFCAICLLGDGLHTRWCPKR